MALTREELLAPVPVVIEKVEIPELNSHVWVKGMTAAGRTRFERQFKAETEAKSNRRQQEVRERLVVACCCDESGVLLFSIEDVKALGKQSLAIVERIVLAAQKLIGLTDEDVEELAKNSEETDEDN